MSELTKTIQEKGTNIDFFELKTAEQAHAASSIYGVQFVERRKAFSLSLNF
jgi:hypothetical protein